MDPQIDGNEGFTEPEPAPDPTPPPTAVPQPKPIEEDTEGE